MCERCRTSSRKQGCLTEFKDSGFISGMLTSACIHEESARSLAGSHMPVICQAGHGAPTQGTFQEAIEHKSAVKVVSACSEVKPCLSALAVVIYHVWLQSYCPAVMQLASHPDTWQAGTAKHSSGRREKMRYHSLLAEVTVGTSLQSLKPEGVTTMLVW